MCVELYFGLNPARPVMKSFVLVFADDLSLGSPDSALLYPDTGALVCWPRPGPGLGEAEQGGGQGRVQEAAVGRGRAVGGAVTLVLHARAAIQRAWRRTPAPS